MGIYINYDLWLPSDIGEHRARNLLAELRAACAEAGAGRVGPMLEFSVNDLLGNGDQYGAWTASRFAWSMARCSMNVPDGDTKRSPATGKEHAASMFFLYPGEGSEAASFGLVRPGIAVGEPSATRADVQDRWFWSGWCKTQYASRVSDEHLLHCHTVVVRGLEAAQQLGFGVQVRDETGYWDSRSETQLFERVREMNRLVARVAGALHDRTSLAIESPIFDDPDFERLETEATFSRGPHRRR